MKRKILIILNLVWLSPLILYKYFKFLLFKRKISVLEFKPNNVYCVDCTLNQLIWNVENSLFNVLSNSSKIYLDSGELIFKVMKGDTSFSIISYGYNKVLKSKTFIQIVTLKQKTFDNKEFHLLKFPSERKKTQLVLRNNINKGLIKIKSYESVRLKQLNISNAIWNKKPIMQIHPTREINEINQTKHIIELRK